MKSGFRQIRSLHELKRTFQGKPQVNVLEQTTRAPTSESPNAVNAVNADSADSALRAVRKRTNFSGRIALPRGIPNQREKAFLQFLKSEGWTPVAFEALRVELAHRCWYTPDVLATKPGEKITFFEVKGFWEDDARVKIKVAARLLPPQFAIKTAVLKNRVWHVRPLNDPHAQHNPKVLPTIELMHPDTGKRTLTVPIRSFSLNQHGKLILDLDKKQLETAFLQYLLYQATGQIVPKPLSPGKAKQARRLRKQTQLNLQDFRAQWLQQIFN